MLLYAHLCPSAIFYRYLFWSQLSGREIRFSKFVADDYESDDETQVDLKQRALFEQNKREEDDEELSESEESGEEDTEMVDENGVDTSRLTRSERATSIRGLQGNSILFFIS
jgi:hypothetical protein